MKAAGLGDASGWRARGVALLQMDPESSEGGDAYLHGLSMATEEALYRYREDIAPLLTSEEERERGRLLPDAERSWIRTKWEWRASTAGRTVAGRLGEHFRRLKIAMRNYLRLAH